jgi:hypothetical protein
MIPTERLQRILMEVIEDPSYQPEESAEAMDVRRRLRAEVAEIKARGGVVEIPPEIEV